MLKYLTTLAKNNESLKIDLTAYNNVCFVNIADKNSDVYGRGKGKDFEAAAIMAAKNYLEVLSDRAKGTRLNAEKHQDDFDNANNILGKIMVMDNDD